MVPDSQPVITSKDANTAHPSIAGVQSTRSERKETSSKTGVIKSNPKYL